MEKESVKQPQKLESTVKIVKSVKKQPSKISPKVSTKCKKNVPKPCKDVSLDMSDHLTSFMQSMKKMMSDQLSLVRKEFNEALENRSKVQPVQVSPDLNDVLQEVVRTLADDILTNNVVEVQSGSVSGACSLPTPSVVPAVFSEDSLVQDIIPNQQIPQDNPPDLCVSPPGFVDAESSARFHDSSLVPSHSDPAIAPRSDRVLVGTRPWPDPSRHVTGDGAACSIWGGSAGSGPVTRMTASALKYNLGAEAEIPNMTSSFALDISSVRPPLDSRTPFSVGGDSSFSIYSRPSTTVVMTTALTGVGGVSAASYSFIPSRVSTSIPVLSSACVSTSSLASSTVHSSSFGECNAFYTTSISCFPISSTIPFTATAPSQYDSAPLPVSAPSRVRFDWFATPDGEEQVEKGEWVEEEQVDPSDTFEPFKELSSLAGNLGPVYVAREKQEKRPSPYELSNESAPKYRKASQYLSWSGVILEAWDMVNDKFKQASDQARTIPRFLLPFSGGRAFYSTGKSPELLLSPEFYAVLDGRKKFNNNLNILFPQHEMRLTLKSMHQVLENLSFLSWHVGSIGSFLKSAAAQVEVDPSCASQKFTEAHVLLGSLDRAVTDAVGILVPSMASLLVRFRFFFTTFLNPLVSLPRKSELLYGNVSLGFVLDPDILEIIREEVKVAESSAMSRALALSAARLAGPRPSSSARGKGGRGRSFSRSRSPQGRRPFRGASSSARSDRSRAGRGRARPSK